MTPTPDEVAALVKRLRDILKFDDDLTEDDKLRLEAADALESLSPPAGMVMVPRDDWCVLMVREIGERQVGNSIEVATTIWNHVVRMLAAAPGAGAKGKKR